MCGLVGVAGATTFKIEKAFRTLLELDTMRGPHSTGILQVKPNGDATVVKALGTPWELYEQKKCEDIFKGSSCVLLGHNRWATKGAISKSNAHPFEFSNIIGAHNGTLTTTWQLDDHLEFDVDSQNIYHHMNKNDVYDTIPNLNGAYALTWYNKKEKTVNFIRNKERPLYLVFTEDMKTLFWASEAWMLIVALEKVDIKHLEVFELPVDTLHTFEVDLAFAGSAKPFEKARIRALKGYETKKSTVTTFLGGKSTVTSINSGQPPVGKRKLPHSELSKRVGKLCVFFVGKVETSISGQQFFQCWDVANEDVQLRVYPTEGSDLWKQLESSIEYFEGLVKACNMIEGGYLTVDIRSIKEVPTSFVDIPNVPETYKGFEDEEITLEQWNERVKCNCSWCASPVELDDHQEIAWIDKYTFLCPDCAVQPELQQYINAK